MPTHLGKAPTGQKNLVFVEYDRLLELMSRYLPQIFNDYEHFVQFLRTEKLLDSFADQFILQLPNPRQDYYLQKLDKVSRDILGYMHFAEDALGYYPVNIDAMLMQDFKKSELSVIFL
eukprot:CAMPEP_0116879066 /NCGR_PEP_ID=MMETSP0463-20121206/10814_1 /TAXON_ID=181622 /ORGANISM="Strombidinopsis sp, Strain SopsisLIS2011" /LENGTH=117 /DNA_ID=CAMNT_0004527911 /DNA_START=902 /DNA_END=1255 /DNA_ORIENTATION=+